MAVNALYSNRGLKNCAIINGKLSLTDEVTGPTVLTSIVEILEHPIWSPTHLFMRHLA